MSSKVNIQWFIFMIRVDDGKFIITGPEPSLKLATILYSLQSRIKTGAKMTYIV